MGEIVGGFRGLLVGRIILFFLTGFVFGFLKRVSFLAFCVFLFSLKRKGFVRVELWKGVSKMIGV